MVIYAITKGAKMLLLNLHNQLRIFLILVPRYTCSVPVDRVQVFSSLSHYCSSMSYLESCLSKKGNLHYNYRFETEPNLAPAANLSRGGIRGADSSGFLVFLSLVSSC